MCFVLFHEEFGHTGSCQRKNLYLGLQHHSIQVNSKEI